MYKCINVFYIFQRMIKSSTLFLFILQCIVLKCNGNEKNQLQKDLDRRIHVFMEFNKKRKKATVYLFIQLIIL